MVGYEVTAAVLVPETGMRMVEPPTAEARQSALALLAAMGITAEQQLRFCGLDRKFGAFSVNGLEPFGTV